MTTDMKACTKCGESKPLDDFHKSNSIKSGYGGVCKVCDRAKGKAYYEANKERVLARSAKNKAKDPEKTAATNAAWHQANKARRQADAAAWRKANPEKSRAYTKAWEDRNPGSSLERNRRRQRTVRGRLENVIRAGMFRGITRSTKAGRKSFDILGYTADDVRARMELLFQPGMSWDNYGKDGWEIDHIIPLAAHNYETPDDIDFKHAWALTNLQPLWGKENRSKGDRITEPFQPSLLLEANDNSLRKAA